MAERLDAKIRPLLITDWYPGGTRCPTQSRRDCGLSCYCQHAQQMGTGHHGHACPWALVRVHGDAHAGACHSMRAVTGSGLDSHPAFSKSMAFLKECGVHVIYEPEKYPPKNEVPCRLSPCITHEHVSVLGDERAWLWQAVSSCVGFHETVWVGVALRNGYMREMSVATYDQHTFAAWNLRAFHDTPFLDTST